MDDLIPDAAGFLDPLRVESVDPINWKFLERFRWKGSQGDIFEIEPGELTDFATVPWWTQAIFPRTGTWSKAAALHDKMCRLQNEYYKLQPKGNHFLWVRIKYDAGVVVKKPVFTSIDTDAIFYKNARADGTDPVRAELLWFGVRTGSLINPARREEWLQTSLRYFADLIVILAFLAAIVLLIVRP